MKNVLKPLAKSVLTQLGLTAAASATDAVVKKNIFVYGMVTIISNEEMDDIMKIIKFYEDSGLLIKGVCETIKNEAKEKRAGFLSVLLGTLGASSLRNLLTVKGAISIRAGTGTTRAGEGTIRAGQDL